MGFSSIIHMGGMCLSVFMFSLSIFFSGNLKSENGTLWIDGKSMIAETDSNFVCATLDWWPPGCESCNWGSKNSSLLNLKILPQVPMSNQEIVPVATISDEEKLSSLATERIFHRFSLADIKLATLNFDDVLVIGKGGFGKVYKGHMHGTNDTAAHLVAIKRLDSFSKQGASEFMTEIEMLSKLRHCHLVSLIGYCSDSKEMILVYEYMPNGTIEHHLHKAESPLSWMHRLNISIGAARGLDYLHTGVGTQHGVIHRDVKSSNILLDQNWAAKIADFGLSKIINQPSSAVSTALKGTFGYLDPDYYMTGHLTKKSDVYAFGVVLFELLSGRRAVDTRYSEEEWNLANWAQKCIKERSLDQIVSAHITEQISPKSLKEFAQIADRCLKSSRKERPTMAEVVVALQLSMTLQEQFDRSSLPVAGTVRFTYKMPKYLVFGTKNNSADPDTQSSTDCGLMGHSFRMFSYSDMELATRNFSSHMLLGQGHYGEVFRGWLNKRTYTPSLCDSGLTIAIRRLYPYKFKPHKLNMKILEEFNDPSIVKILGYCVEEDTVLIIYEFMNQGTLNDYLFSVVRVTERHQLILRVKIAIGVARGLVFLHTQPKLGDCSLQMHNIFLDEELNVKLSDFDVAMLVLSSDATSHFNPGSFHYSKVKSGVFGFGVILMELLTGKPIDNECELTVTKDFLPGEHGFVFMQSIRYALDSRLRFDILLTRPAIQLALLSQKCVADKSYLRPTLISVLEELEEIYAEMLKFDKSGN